jgi:predicted RecB family nuclease
MQRIDRTFLLSASDLIGHLNCRNLTELDIAVAKGTVEKPKVWNPFLDVLRERGLRHEQDYVEHLRSKGLEIEAIAGVGLASGAVAATAEAMKLGRSVIVQGAFLTDIWGGRTDVLLRVERPSDLGNWSYQVVDTKLSRETKGGTVLQLSLYSELVGKVQGLMPEWSHVLAPWSDYQPQSFRTGDFSAYYRRVKSSLEDAVRLDQAANEYPDPKPYCDVCRWQDRCDAKRREDDHPSLIAGISKIQITELGEHAVATGAALAAMPIPLTFKPSRGSIAALERVREQARIQIEGRAAGATLYERLDPMPGYGLAKLYEPSAGDIFFDFEGDPFVGDGGLEYLFGYTFLERGDQERYVGAWALSRAQERAAFEQFIDFVMDRLRTYSDLHIYHFAPYEPAALKRLMGRYATREDELDQLLRGKRFVDLFAVVRQGIRASVESYSIKRLEPLYGFVRERSLSDANQALFKVQAHLELGDVAGIGDCERKVVEAYNRDDCRSTSRLRDFFGDRTGLGHRRRYHNRQTRPVERRAERGGGRMAIEDRGPSGPARRGRSRCPCRTDGRATRAMDSVPLSRLAPPRKQSILVGVFPARGPAEDLLDERAGLSGLAFEKVTGGTAKAPTHRYRFPPQETELRGGESVHAVGGSKLGKVDEISIDDGWVDIKKRRDTATLHPDALFAHDNIDTKVLAEALLRIGEHVADHGLAGAGPYQAARDLLLRHAPRLGGQLLRYPGEAALTAGLRLALALDGGVLPIQGPPGSGKTYIGARMITTLVSAGFRVGVTANSHKVIRNLLDDVRKAADSLGIDLTCIQKVSEKAPDEPRLRLTTDNAACLAALRGDCRVAGGTAWFWTRPDAFQAVDVLFVDEAGQMSLANVLAVSQAAKNLILLGDPQQLDQPTQGSHPDGTEGSALDHILDGRQTVREDQGLFLEETWRLHPTICAFTSELFYEGRLRPRAGLEAQEIRSSGPVAGSGLRYKPVSHTGNQSSSPEEAEVVRALVGDILALKPTWINREGVEQPLRRADILIIAPYNAQVFELQSRLPGARIGTVDKFQGQEAPLVIYSMTTSTYADAPRGMEFLYSLNRLNVAVSRAQCVCVLVASPTVFEAACRTPAQMRLANAYCRYLELAQPI